MKKILFLIIFLTISNYSLAESGKFNAAGAGYNNGTYENVSIKGDGTGAVGFGGTSHQTGLIEGVDGGGLKLYTAGNDVNWGGAWSLNTTLSGQNMSVEGSVTAGSFVISTEYKIVTVGTTDFTAIGSSANTVETVFTATGAGTGNGTARPTGYYLVFTSAPDAGNPVTALHNFDK